jgi:flap endonuclease-1
VYTPTPNMGIRYLNAFLKNNCRDGINDVHLQDLSGISVAIDASIYMYQYEMDNRLVECMDMFIDVLNGYHIKPVFVFDGKPPAEKSDIINERKEKRKQASLDCKELVAKLNDDTLDSDMKDVLTNEYERLKRTSVFINKDKISRVKTLLDERNVAYYNASGEADEMCAQLVLSGHCWGCMSDDMDMFVYGCNNVIRNVNIQDHTATLYNLPDILKCLNISYENFKSICIISGTDYNKICSEQGGNVNSMNLYTALNLYNRFVKKVKYQNMTFYSWLKHYIKYDMDYDSLHKIHDMFTINTHLITIPVS